MEGTRIIWVCVLCAIAGVSGNVLVKDGCAQGPEFWCQDLVTAAKCGAIDHCKDTVWKEGEDPLCGECKQIVAIILNMVKTSSIQDTIKNFMHKQCSHLPITPLIFQCNQLVDQYEAIAIELLESQIKPQAICGSLAFCSSGQPDSWDSDQMTNHILEKLLPLIQANLYNAYAKASQEQDGKGDLPIPLPMCWMCKSFVGRIEAAIPKDAIAKSASGLCLLLPGKIAGICQCLVERYTVIVLDLILGKLGPQLVCGLLFMCSTELPVMPVLGQDITCDMCLAITYKLKPTLPENATEADIKAALLQVCTDPELDWKECQDFIHKHQAQLIQILQKPWDAKRTCKEAGFCPAVANPTPEHTGCAAGPSYWCRSLDTAKECEAVGHCLTHVWH